MEPFLKELETRLRAVLDHLQGELQTVRSNRPSVGLIEDIKIDYYGQAMPIKQVASLSIRPPRDIEINVWDKSALPSIAKGIESANTGLSVRTDGASIIVSLPQLTDERRTEFMKLAKNMGEETRIQVRAAREDINKQLKGAEDEGALNEDQLFKGREAVQKQVEAANQKIESMLEAKIKELAE